MALRTDEQINRINEFKKTHGEEVLPYESAKTAEELANEKANITDEEKKKVEDLVNKWIGESLPVQHEEISKNEAIVRGAIHLFGEKYGDIVSVYTIGSGKLRNSGAVSIEFCGGPHVKNTEEIGHFKITKEEAVSAGVRRIKAVVE